jgi:hypothetical protein
MPGSPGLLLVRITPGPRERFPQGAYFVMAPAIQRA